MLFLALKDPQTPVLVLPTMKTLARTTSRTRQSLSLLTPPMVAIHSVLLQLNIMHCLWSAAIFSSFLSFFFFHM